MTGDERETAGVALVAGAAGGIGAEVARCLAARGHRLVLVDRDEAGLGLLADELGTALAVAPMVVDVGVPAELKAAWDKLPPLARPDILVNSVGGDTRPISLLDLDEDDLSSSLRDNLFGVFTLTRLCVPSMIERGRGRIVNLASVAGRTYTVFSNAAYVAAKAAVIGFTKQCAYEFARHGIAVNAVAHGPIATERIMQSWRFRSDADRERLLSKIPAGRLGSVAEAAAAVVHLCSDEANYTVGCVIDVNGGLYI
jgi:3-oxoacyl-[acyl-carrier protein] reductase